MDNIISGINVSGQVYTILDPNAIHESEFSAYSGAVDTSLSSKASQTTVDALNDVVTAHTADTSIHLTSGDIETIISSQTADFVTGEELSSYTYDKATIDSKIASGGTFDPTQYYNKTATDELLAEKLDASAYTPTDLSNYYNKQEVDGIVASAKTEIEGEIPSLSGYATEQWVLDKNYITGVDLSNYDTKSEVNTKISEATSGKANSADVYLKSETSGASQIQEALNTKADPYSAGTGISISGNVISTTGGGDSYTAGRGIDIDSGNTISFDLPISAGTGTDALVYNFTGNTASGNYSHAEGFLTKTSGDSSHAEGFNTVASGDSSHAEGYSTKASGNYSHAEGNGTQASGNYSHVEGSSAQASGNYSHAEGEYTSASGERSHSEGNSTVANGQNSHAEGYNTNAYGQNSHAEGYKTQAHGQNSHAEGQETVANGDFSHSEGSYTITYNNSEHASGEYNISRVDTLFSVGNGVNENNRHNAFEISHDGSIYIPDLNGGNDYYDRPMIKLQDYIVKIWKGTKAEFDAITVKDNNTIYLVTN